MLLIQLILSISDLLTTPIQVRASIISITHDNLQAGIGSILGSGHRELLLIQWSSLSPLKSWTHQIQSFYQTTTLTRLQESLSHYKWEFWTCLITMCSLAYPHSSKCLLSLIDFRIIFVNINSTESHYNTFTLAMGHDVQILSTSIVPLS